MILEGLPEWITELESEDLTFIKKFLLSSGSLKEVALLYGVTYPTVRLRLDRLIQKINISQQSDNDSFISSIKKLAIDGKISIDIAKTIILKYKDQRKELE
ncbi:MAG: DUF2089 domain-containing protein [Firmicutes bacterium]|nr:DUF2089 domain-containing protein [Bacillota bacterium]